MFSTIKCIIKVMIISCPSFSGCDQHVSLHYKGQTLPFFLVLFLPPLTSKIPITARFFELATTLIIATYICIGTKACSDSDILMMIMMYYHHSILIPIEFKLCCICSI